MSASQDPVLAAASNISELSAKIDEQIKKFASDAFAEIDRLQAQDKRQKEAIRVALAYVRKSAAIVCLEQLDWAAVLDVLEKV